MDLQVVLVILLGLIVINLLAVGIYIIFLIKDLRETVKRARVVLENIQNVSNSVASPVTTLAGVVSAVVESVKAAKAITTLRGPGSSDDEEQEEK